MDPSIDSTESQTMQTETMKTEKTTETTGTEVKTVKPQPKLFEGARKNWKFVLKFLIVSIVFWLIQFAHQYYVLNFELGDANLGISLVRSFALAGATYFGFALLSSTIFKWKREWNRYWHVRRSFGVMGFVFILFHVLSVIQFYFSGDTSGIFYSINPFENPIIFGVIAFPIFFIMAITSTDWAVNKLGAKWKIIHRLVYFGYLASVFHFLLINPKSLMNIMGYLLIVTTFLVLASEVFWFIKTAGKRNFSTLGTGIGILIIFVYLIISYFAYFVPK